MPDYYTTPEAMIVSKQGYANTSEFPFSHVIAEPCLSAEWAAIDARETYRAAVATWDDAFADYYAEALVSGALSRKADALYVAKAAAWAAVEAASDTMHRTREEAADARC